MTKLAEDRNELTNSEEVPVNPEEDYTKAPVDETFNEYEQYERMIDIPDHEIIALDYEYVTTRHTTFSFKKELSYHPEDSLNIYDNENKKMFSCRDNNHKVDLIYYQDNVLLSICEDALNINNFKIYDVRDDIEKELATIKKANKKFSNFDIYKVEYINKYNGNREELEIRIKYDENLFYEVYCNVGKENETMISKITEKKKSFVIEIAPGVDYTLMLGFCAIFYIKMNKIKNSKSNVIGALSFICCIQ